VLAGGLVVTHFSALPTVGLFGAVVIAILVVALAADLFVLPSITLYLERRKNQRERQ
jgi:predicted RND superfamily exporter protein